MHIHKKHMAFLGFIVLLINTPNIVNTMEISKPYFQEGTVVKTSLLDENHLIPVQDVDLNYPIDNQPDYSTETEDDESPAAKKITIHGIPIKKYFEWFDENVQPTITATRKERECRVYKKRLMKEIIDYKTQMTKNENLNKPNATRNDDSLVIKLRITGQEFNFINNLHVKYPCFSFKKIYTLYFTI